jgi:hypothetical protein
LGDHPGERAIQEATLQTRVVETVLVNALQIFDED